MVGVVASFDARPDTASKFQANPATRDSAWVRYLIIGVGLSYFALFLLLPLIAVFVEAFRKGAGVYFSALVEPDALSAIRLTLLAGPSRSSSSAARTF